MDITEKNNKHLPETCTSVLVIPPNILQQWGISLGNVTITDGDDCTNGEKDAVRINVNSNGTRETSCLKIHANLGKFSKESSHDVDNIIQKEKCTSVLESVFLNTSCTSAFDIDISQCNKNDDCVKQNSKTKCNTNENVFEKNTDQNLNLTHHIENSSEHVSPGNKEITSIINKNIVTNISKNIHYKVNCDNQQCLSEKYVSTNSLGEIEHSDDDIAESTLEDITNNDHRDYVKMAEYLLSDDLIEPENVDDNGSQNYSSDNCDALPDIDNNLEVLKKNYINCIKNSKFLSNKEKPSKKYGDINIISQEIITPATRSQFSVDSDTITEDIENKNTLSSVVETGTSCQSLPLNTHLPPNNTKNDLLLINTGPSQIEHIKTNGSNETDVESKSVKNSARKLTSINLITDSLEYKKHMLTLQSSRSESNLYSNMNITTKAVHAQVDNLALKNEGKSVNKNRYINSLFEPKLAQSAEEIQSSVVGYPEQNLFYNSTISVNNRLENEVVGVFHKESNECQTLFPDSSCIKSYDFSSILITKSSLDSKSRDDVQFEKDPLSSQDMLCKPRNDIDGSGKRVLETLENDQELKNSVNSLRENDKCHSNASFNMKQITNNYEHTKNVCQIANYLKKVMQLCKTKKKMSMNQSNNLKELLPLKIQNKRKLKLDSERVEEPGGLLNSVKLLQLKNLDSNIRSYKNLNKLIPKNDLNSERNLNSSSVVETNSIDLTQNLLCEPLPENKCNIGHTTCICADFGYLCYNDNYYDADYQHIHFINDRSSTCSNVSVDFLINEHEKQVVGFNERKKCVDFSEELKKLNDYVEESLKITDFEEAPRSICWKNFDNLFEIDGNTKNFSREMESSLLAHSSDVSVLDFKNTINFTLENSVNEPNTFTSTIENCSIQDGLVKLVSIDGSHNDNNLLKEYDFAKDGNAEDFSKQSKKNNGKNECLCSDRRNSNEAAVIYISPEKIYLTQETDVANITKHGRKGNNLYDNGENELLLNNIKRKRFDTITSSDFNLSGKVDTQVHHMTALTQNQSNKDSSGKHDEDECLHNVIKRKKYNACLDSDKNDKLQEHVTKTIEEEGNNSLNTIINNNESECLYSIIETDTSFDQEENVKSHHSLHDSVYDNSSNLSLESVENPLENDMDSEDHVKCGVCEVEINTSEWIKHIQNKHNYLAWQQGENPLELSNHQLIYNYLTQLSKKIGGLVCSSCGLVRKYGKAFLTHTKNCIMEESVISSLLQNKIEEKSFETSGKNEDEYVFTRTSRRKPYVNSSNTSLNSEVFDEPQISKLSSNVLNDYTRNKRADCIENRTDQNNCVKCGVCEMEMDIKKWIEHIQLKHQYCAWKQGEDPVDLSDRLQVCTYLTKLAKEIGGLVCNTCGLSRKYGKKYLSHIETCVQKMDESCYNSCISETFSNSITDITETVDAEDMEEKQAIVKTHENVKCGVCAALVTSDGWIEHIGLNHNYLAWKEGETPLDLSLSTQVWNHLNNIIKLNGTLVCNKCGTKRKYPKNYLDHIDKCVKQDASSGSDVDIESSDFVTCGVCAKKIDHQKWRRHLKQQHFNLSWKEGETPMDLTDAKLIHRTLLILKKKGVKFVCPTCGACRGSTLGFYAHIITCKKTEEEINKLKEECELCQKKYLTIYRQQHNQYHKVQDSNRLKQNIDPDSPAEGKKVGVTNRRQAAVKAREVLEVYKFNSEQYLDVPKDCGDDNNSNYDCKETDEDYSASEKSNDSTEDEEDFNVTDQCLDSTPRKRRHKISIFGATRPVNLDLDVKDPYNYIKNAMHDFCKMNFTHGTLFPEFTCSEIETVREDQLPGYIPSHQESCQVHFNKEKLKIYKQFEAENIEGDIGVFLGGSPICLSWVPPSDRMSIQHEDQFLAVSTHKCLEYEGLDYDSLYTDSAMLQLWKFSSFNKVTIPTLELGILHDFGIVWSMDWCPSGTRDYLEMSTCNKVLRLGLLAVACSNGSAYIFSVPHPSTLKKKEKPFHKFKPKVELKLTISSDRKLYQATTIHWAIQNGHTTIVVGYADGTIALYDLNSQSSLLRHDESGMTVLYPYHETANVSGPITGISMYPYSNEGFNDGAAVGTSGPGGSMLMLRTGITNSIVQLCRISGSGVSFMPHWSSLMFTSDEYPARSQIFNGLDSLHGPTRRSKLGNVVTMCLNCANIATVSTNLLHVVEVHPANMCPKRMAKLKFGMTPLQPIKNRKKVNDNYEIKLEPNTYDGAIKKYGLNICRLQDKGSGEVKSESPAPERFSLSEVNCLAFCPSALYHDQLAFANKAGMLFVFNIPL